MKHLAIIFACAALASLVGCGGSSNNIKSVLVNPQQAQGSGPGGAVGFTATGTFPNNQSRPLTSLDGLMWSSSDPSIATIGSSSGQALCQAAGGVTITAAVPSDLTFQGGGHTSSQSVKGTATLQCTVGA